MTAARLAKTVAEPTAKNSFIFTILGTKWGILWLWLLIINVVAFLAYGGDKLLAKLKEHQPRIRNKRFFHSIDSIKGFCRQASSRNRTRSRSTPGAVSFAINARSGSGRECHCGST